MDKSWMQEPTRCSDRYIKGVEEFLRMARQCMDVNGIMRCPCRDCANRYFCHIELVESHLYEHGIDRTYTQWIFHGEDPCSINVTSNLHTDTNVRTERVDEMEELLDDVRMGTFFEANIGESSTTGPTTDNEEHRTPFGRLWEDGMGELYPGCTKFTKVAFILKMLHIKTICNISNKAFDMIIKLIKETLPDGETLPRSYREAKRFCRDLSFGYESIHAPFLMESQLNLSYRRHRSTLHLDHYKKFFQNVDSQDLAAMDDAKREVRANVPKGISPGQWPIICDSFESDSWKQISERNKKNRAEMKTNHTAGSSPFVNVVYKKAQITKVTPNPIEIYKETHFSEKSKKFVSEYAESKYKEMESIAANSDNVDIRPEDIVLKVLGGHRSGHVRGQGCGVIPIRSNSLSTHHHDECLSKQLETEHKLAESLEKCAQLEESQAALRAEMNASQAALQAQMNASQAAQQAQQAQIDRLLKHLGGLGGSSHESQASESNI